MPVCTNCGSQQPDGAAFCDECGAKLEKAIPPTALPAAGVPQHTPTVVSTACPVCGTSVIPGEAFCDNCGAALGYTAPVPQPQVPVPASPSAMTVPAPSVQADALTCTNCGAQLEPGSNFCDMCGAPAGTMTPASPPVSVPGPSPAPTIIPPPKPVPAAPSPISVPAPSAATPSPTHSPGATIQGHLVAQRTNTTLPFPPGRTEVIIGREDPVSNVFPEIDLTDHGGDEGGVSRRHARIFVQGTQIFVEDLNSTNYTHVNQQRLTPGHPHPLNDGDELRFGRVKLNYYST